jgi:predicted enzyme related to lactoylglutathione lyase
LGNREASHVFGFRLKQPEDIDEILEKVIDAGGKIIDKGEFVPDSPFIFFKDPESYEIEVWDDILE